ncbi:MAG TPA: M56 family metallopeptidase [Planctomycetaceae bacterium]|jgi:beta-lactamase regulating signal transducer with metallopeptidase domain
MNHLPLNLWEQWQHSPGAMRLGSALLYFIWQGALVAAITWLLLGALKRTKPQVRYAALLVMLGMLAACPVVTYCAVDVDAAQVAAETRSRNAPYLPFAHVAATSAAGNILLPANSLVNTLPREQASSAEVAWRTRLNGAGEWLQQHRYGVVPLWLAGVCLVSLRLVAGLIGAERARRRGTAAASGPAQQIVARLAARMNIRGTVRVLESALAEAPALVGWLRPVILLPTSAVIGLTPTQMEAVLAHELAHVLRHDYLVNLLQTVVETILFYHPAVWWISRWIRQEREHCCDDLAIALCADRVAYARALTALEELCAAPARWVVAARGGSLVERIRRIVGRPEPAGSGKPALVAIAAVLMFVAAVTIHLRQTASAGDPATTAAASNDDKDKVKEQDEPREQPARAEARRMQFEETLRRTSLGNEIQPRTASTGKERAIDQIGEKNAPVPREYQKVWESYTRRLSQKKNAPVPREYQKAWESYTRSLSQRTDKGDGKAKGPELPAGDQPTPKEPEKAASDARRPWSAHGHVTDAEGQPLAGVVVTAHTGRGTLRQTGKAETDAEGKYAFDFGPGIAFAKNDTQLQAATITAHKAGFSEKNLSRQGNLRAALKLPAETAGAEKEDTKNIILPGQPRQIDFVMVPAAKVTGRLIDKDAAPLAGYSISLRGDEMPPSSNVVATTKTDEQGRFELADIPTGFKWQFLVEPAKRQPPWNAWASGRMVFRADDGNAAFFIQGEGKGQDLAANRFEIQVLGEGRNWKTAVKVGGQHQRLDITGYSLTNKSRVQAAGARLVLTMPAVGESEEPAAVKASSSLEAGKSKTNLKRTMPDGEGRFSVTFDNPLTKRDAQRLTLDPEENQVIFQIFVKDADGKLVEKIFKQLAARETGGYRVDVQVKPELIDTSTISLTFVTIQPEHDQWVKAFFHEGKGTSYKGLWSGDGGKLSAVTVE